MTQRAPVLLLHGQPGSARDFDLVRGMLDPSLRTLAFDRPGYDGVTPPGGIEYNARIALQRLDAAGIDRSVVVGMSYGGGIAAWLAAFHPERVSGLVLVSATANRAALTAFDRILAAPGIGCAASVVMVTVSGQLLRSRWLRRGADSLLHLPEGDLEAMGETMRSPTTLRAFMIEQRTMQDELPRLEAQLGGIRAPTYVVVGTEDRIVPTAAGRALAASIPEAELIEVAHAGHALTTWHPERVAEVIARAAGPDGEARS